MAEEASVELPERSALADQLLGEATLLERDPAPGDGGTHGRRAGGVIVLRVARLRTPVLAGVAMRLPVRALPAG